MQKLIAHKNVSALTAIATAVLTMTSREIAELTDKVHKNVTADIVKMLSDLGEDALNFQRIYFDSMNRPQIEYALDRELTETLLTGYSAVLRRKVIARWHELEASQPKFDPATLTRSDILRLALESEEARVKAESERDIAIATKAQIGSRREATAMATASAAARETQRLKIQLGQAVSHATVRAIESATGHSYGWKPLKDWCRTNGLKIISVPEQLYGHVNSYPAEAWLSCFGLNIAAVLGVKND